MSIEPTINPPTTASPTPFVVPYAPVGTVFGAEEIEALERLLRSGKSLSCNEQRDTFESMLSEFIGVKHALTVTSCTVGLDMAFHLLGLKAGDEVISTPLTYQATVLPLLTTGVKVRFADVEPNGLSIDPNKLPELINHRTKAIILTHYAGLMADMDPIMEIAAAHRIKVVTDCAHAHGATYKGRQAGSVGDIGVFSFQSLKNITTLGQGGLLTFDHDLWNSIIRNIRGTEPDARFRARNVQTFGTHGLPKYDVYLHEKNSYTEDCEAIYHSGTNATLSEPQCAVGIEQLRKLPDFLNRRNAIRERLNQGIQDLPGIRVQEVPEGRTHSAHLYCCFLDPALGMDRDLFAHRMQEEGVEIVLRYFPIHLHPEWRQQGHRYGDCPVAEDVWFKQLINLPLYPHLTDTQVDFMVEKFRKVYVSMTRQKRIG